MYSFTEGSYAPRNGWYLAAFIKEIGEALLSRWILNQPVVLYRKEDGTAVAVEGRCPHLPPELILKSDDTTVLGRRALQRMMDAERAEV